MTANTNAEWLVINALRVAAEQWRQDATVDKALEMQFHGQAQAAMSLADQIESGAARLEIEEDGREIAKAREDFRAALAAMHPDNVREL